MSVLRVDAGLLDAGPPALEAAVADTAGGATLLRLEPPWPTRPDRDTLGTLASLPLLTLGVGDPPEPARVSLDLVAADDDAADRSLAGFQRAPLAAVAAALMIRTRRPDGDVFAGLVAESTTYSALQAGPEFRRWLAGRDAVAADDTEPRLRVERRERVTEIVLTRPAKHNAVDARMRDALYEALTDELLSSGPIVVRGDGPSFCSGGDLDEFGTLDDVASAHLVRLGRSLAWRFAQLRGRLVVGLHGTCLGAGIELPAFAANVVAADDAELGLPELGLGLVPGAGGTVSIPHRCGRHRLLELLLLAGTIPASTALEWGLVDEIVPASQLEERLFEAAAAL